jgi:hypothetical protein
VREGQSILGRLFADGSLQSRQRLLDEGASGRHDALETAAVEIILEFG